MFNFFWQFFFAKILYIYTGEINKLYKEDFMTINGTQKVLVLKTKYGDIKEGATEKSVYDNKNLLNIFSQADINGDKKLSAEEIWTFQGTSINTNDQNFYPGLILDECSSNGLNKFKELDTNINKELSSDEIKIGILEAKIKELEAIKSDPWAVEPKYYADLRSKRGSTSGSILAIQWGGILAGAIIGSCTRLGSLGGIIGLIAGGLVGTAAALVKNAHDHKQNHSDDASIDNLIQDLKQELENLKNKK